MNSYINSTSRLVVYCLALLLLGCSKEDEKNETFIQKFNGEPYRGSAAVTVDTGSGVANPVNGTSGVQLMDVKGDSATLVVTTKLPNINSLNLRIRGNQMGKAWQSGANELNLNISPEGLISGETTTAQEKFHFDGSISDTNFVLKMQIVQLQQVQNLPAGTELTVMINAQRDPARSGGDNGDCDLVMRPISTPTGVVMGMVPDCD